MNINTITYLDETGNLSSSCHHHIDNSDILRGYQIMMTTRLVDERMITIQRQGLISFALSSTGEEACSVASAAALEPQDWMYPQYREAGAIFWRGFTIQDYIHHMFCNAKDLSLGRQMPNHFGSRALNIVPVSSPIATKIPHAAGAAYAMKLKNEPSITISYLCDGATSEGDFHAGLNFAAVRKTPTIFFCRNNGYAISTPACRQFASDGIAPKGVGYGITTYRVDGNDFFAIHKVVALARKHCIDGHGPVLIEAMTHRMGAHSTSDDPSLYRQKGEIDLWEKKCPILRLRNYLIKKGLWNDIADKKFIEEINEEISRAISIAKTTPLPPLHTMIEDVYFEIPSSLQRQFEAMKNELTDHKDEAKPCL